jgi:hypothetical protein
MRENDDGKRGLVGVWSVGVFCIFSLLGVFAGPLVVGPIVCNLGISKGGQFGEERSRGKITSYWQPRQIHPFSIPLGRSDPWPGHPIHSVEGISTIWRLEVLTQLRRIVDAHQDSVQTNNRLSVPFQFRDRPRVPGWDFNIHVTNIVGSSICRKPVCESVP